MFKNLDENQWKKFQLKQLNNNKNLLPELRKNTCFGIQVPNQRLNLVKIDW